MIVCRFQAVVSSHRPAANDYVNALFYEKVVYNIRNMWYDTKVNKGYHYSDFGSLRPDLSKW